MDAGNDMKISFCTQALQTMADRTLAAVENATRALESRDCVLAHAVIGSDKAINACEIDLDNMTYTLLAASRLTGEDLRQVLAIQKVTVILERIGDHAVNIAESAISLADDSASHALFDILHMIPLVLKMLSDSLKSFQEKNLARANETLRREEESDRMNIAISHDVRFSVLKGTMTFERAMEIIRVSKNLERIADLATNIAEETCFLISGRIIKHHESLMPAWAECADLQATPAV